MAQSALHSAPAISFTKRENTAASGGGIVTVSGLNMRASDATSTAGIASQSCTTAAWSSGTSVMCSSAFGSGSLLEIVLTASGIVGTRSGQFTFDGDFVLCFYESTASRQVYGRHCHAEFMNNCVAWLLSPRRELSRRG